MVPREILRQRREAIARQRRLRRAILFSLLALLLVLVGSATWFYGRFAVVFEAARVPEDQFIAPVTANANVNILVLGVDQEGARSDTMVLASFDPKAGKLALISLPRDTRTRIAGKGTIERLAHANAYSDRQWTGPARAMQTVSDLLGIPVHYYVRVNFNGFARIVDRLGGVTVDVPQDMFYEDPYQNLYINLKKGRQTLSGQEALQFVRFRQYANGDIGRIRAQQAFIQALVDKLSTTGALARLPLLVNDLSQFVRTNIPLGVAADLARQATALAPGSIEYATLPGRDQTIGGAAYWILDEPATQALIDRLVLKIDRSRNAQVRVQVVDASGQEGTGDRVAAMLSRDGFQVTGVTVAEERSKETRVIDRRKDGGAAAELVAGSLTRQVNEARVYENVQEDAAFDVTVLVGEDWPQPEGGPSAN